MPHKTKYTVSVGNVGNMDYSSRKLAIDCYVTYVTLSKNNEGRAAGEDVILLKDDEIIMEHTGSNPREDDEINDSVSFFTC